MLFGVVSLAAVEDLQVLDPAVALDAISIGREGEQSRRLTTDPASAELTPLSRGDKEGEEEGSQWRRKESGRGGK